jgi:ribosome-binding protein aMBF1 (putative translation factor)
MPQTRLLFFQDANGTAPVWEWLKDLRARNPKAYAKCVVRIRRLAELGHLSETLKMRSQKTPKRTSDALALVEELTGKSHEMAHLLEQEQANLDIARKICELRTKAKLSQAELARKVGTTQSVISRLEDADYDGHSLAMLRRIASALEKRVEIRFLPSPKLRHA